MTVIGVLLCCVGLAVFVAFMLLLAFGLCASASVADARMDAAMDELREDNKRG